MAEGAGFGGIKPFHLIGALVAVTLGGIGLLGGMYTLTAVDDWRVGHLEVKVDGLEKKVEALTVKNAVLEERLRHRD